MQRTLHIARHSERAHELLQHTAAGSPHTKPSERVAVIHPEPTDDKCLQAVEQLTLTVTILNYLVQVVSRSLFIKIIGVICTFNMLCIK